jgi:hypothetical protein
VGGAVSWQFTGRKCAWGRIQYKSLDKKKRGQTNDRPIPILNITFIPSHQSFIKKTVIMVIADNEMVPDYDIQKPAALRKPLGQFYI